MQEKQFCIRHLVHLPLRLNSCSMRSFACSIQLSLLTCLLIQQVSQVPLLTCLLLQQVSQVSLLTCLFSLIGQIGAFDYLLIYLLSQGSCSLNVGWQVKEVFFYHLLFVMLKVVCLLLIVELVFFTQGFTCFLRNYPSIIGPKVLRFPSFKLLSRICSLDSFA